MKLNSRGPGIREELPLSTQQALFRLLEPLTALAIELGLSVQDVYGMVNEAAIKYVRKEQLIISGRANVSGIAATTGISRADVTRIIGSNDRSKSNRRRASPLSSVLSAWQRDPRFLGRDGRPSILTAYGKGATFETLVTRHGRGIPIRALLDELIRSGSVRLSPIEAIHMLEMLPAEDKISAPRIRRNSARAAELLFEMLHQVKRNTNSAHFKQTPKSTKKSVFPKRENLRRKPKESLRKQATDE